MANSDNIRISDKIGGITITDGNQFARIDVPSGALRTIDHAHHEVHDGCGYFASYAVDLGNGATHGVVIVTPNTAEWAHMLFDVTTEGEAQIDIYENVTTVGDGTGVAEINRDRNSTKVAGVVVTHTPNTPSISGATLLLTRHWGSGRGIGGSDRSESEIVLKPNTKYYMLITNAVTTNNYISWLLDWYEMTNKVQIELIK